MPVAPLIAVAAIATTAVGVGVSYMASRDAASAQQGMVEQQQKAEKVREQQMELDARRRKLEMIRNAQRTRAMSLSAATGQNAQLGSGLQGGYGQTSGMTGFNMLGVNQNLQFGRQLFDINQTMGQYQIAYAQAGSMSSLGSGLTSLGGAMMGNMGGMTSLAGNLGFGTQTQSQPMGYGQQMTNFSNQGYGPRGLV